MNWKNICCCRADCETGIRQILDRTSGRCPLCSGKKFSWSGQLDWKILLHFSRTHKMVDGLEYSSNIPNKVIKKIFIRFLTIRVFRKIWNWLWRNSFLMMIKLFLFGFGLTLLWKLIIDYEFITAKIKYSFNSLKVKAHIQMYERTKWHV